MTTRDEHHLRVTFQDNGVGIPKEDLPKMFEKFFRVESNKKMAKGTGLGLNLVPTAVQYLPGVVKTLATSAVAPTALCAIVLNLVLPDEI